MANHGRLAGEWEGKKEAEKRERLGGFPRRGRQNSEGRGKEIPPCKSEFPFVITTATMLPQMCAECLLVITKSPTELAEIDL